MPDRDEVSQHDLDIVRAIHDKYGLNNDGGVMRVTVVMAALQTIGLGRNAETAKVLRCIADIVECPILSYYDEAKIGRRPM